MAIFATIVLMFTINVARRAEHFIMESYIPHLPSTIHDVWPTTDDKLNSGFWNQLRLPRFKVTPLLETQQRQRNRLTSRTINRSPLQYTIYNIADVIKLQLQDFTFLRLLRNGWQQQRNNAYLQHYDDGMVCQQLKQHGLLRYSHIMSYQLFIDGVSLFKNGAEGVTAVYMVNTDLREEDRFNASNIILVGLMSTKCKNEMEYSEFLQKIVIELNRSLAEEGIEVETQDGVVTIGGIITSIILDTKERDEVLLQKMNGYWSCPFCYVKGTTYDGSSNVSYNINLADIQLRDKLSFSFDATFGKFILIYLFTL
jgi:hypothetical protein